MKRSSNSSSAATARPPFAPAETLAEVPFVFYEILQLATENKAAEIVPLIRSVIQVTLLDPDALGKLPQAAESGEPVSSTIQA